MGCFINNVTNWSAYMIWQLSGEETLQDWKTANVSAIFKKGDEAMASNYRPVSLICVANMGFV